MALNLGTGSTTAGWVQVTGKTRWEPPQTPQSIPVDDAGSFIFAEDAADRVMPSRSAVLAAGRFDLHHGIMYQGGYGAAAAALNRPHTWPRHKVPITQHLMVTRLAFLMRGGQLVRLSATLE